MSFLSYLFPYEKIILASALPQTEIMTRMNWLFTQSGGIPNSGGIRGWISGPNMFVLESSYLQFGGVVQNNGVWMTIRMKRNKLTWFLILSGFGLFAIVSIACSGPDNIADKLGPIFVILLIYAGFMTYVVRQSMIIKRYLLHFLQANKTDQP